MKKQIFLLIIFIPLLLTANDEVLFRVNAEPAAMILLDRSGSMASGSPSRIQQALWVMENLLDADGDGVVEDEDRDILGVDVGQMFYYGIPSSGCNPEPYIYTPGESVGNLEADPFGTGYATIWSHMDYTYNSGYTPNGPALYYTSRWVHQYDSSHPDLNCRSYYIILISDGESNKYGTNENYTYTYHNEWQGSWSVVREAAVSYENNNIAVFTVGFGLGITEHGRNELNWAAKWGGTDNPDVYNFSDEDYNPPHCHVYKPADWPMPIPNYWGNTNGWYTPPSTTTSGYRAYPPSYHRCEGYAFIAQTANELSEALKHIFQSIVNANFSFSPASVPVVRTAMSDTSVIIATFRPTSSGFWDGQVKAHSFHGDTVIGDVMWSAGDSLLYTSQASRNIYWTHANSREEFTAANVMPVYLGGGITTAQKDLIVSRVRQGNSEVQPGWKMGDVFHSAPLMIGAPSPFYNGDDSYIFFRRQHAYRDTRKRVYVGTNTGVLHCLNGATGHEEWAWIPSFALPELRIWALDGSHTYILDGPVTAADLWSDLDSNGLRDASDWRTFLILGQREGGNNYFVLDITEVPLNPDTSDYPKFVTEFNSAPLEGGMITRTFGNTWSQPTAGQFWVDPDGSGVDTAQPVWGFMMGGGYVPDANNNPIPDTGDFLAIMPVYRDLQTTYAWNSPESNGIASSVSLMDMNIDGYVDELAVPDLGGNLLLIDNIQDTADPAAWNFRNVFAPESAAPADADLVSFFPVAVALDISANTYYCYGTGNRDDPMDSTGYGYFFIFRNPPAVGAPASLDDLDSLTSTGCPPGNNGWFYRHLHQGEKVTSLPLIYQGYVYWTTFTPDLAVAGPCEVGAGYARLYVATLATGRLVNIVELGHIGIPSSPQVTVGPDGPVVVIMTSGGPVVTEIAGPGLKKKYVYWNEVY